MSSYQDQLNAIRERRRREFEEKKKEERRQTWLPQFFEKYGKRGQAIQTIQRAVRNNLLCEPVNMTPEEVDNVPGTFRVRFKFSEDNLVQPEPPKEEPKPNPPVEITADHLPDGEDGGSPSYEDVMRESMLSYQGEGVEFDEAELAENRAIMESMGMKGGDDEPTYSTLPAYDYDEEPQPSQPFNPFQHLDGNLQQQISKFFGGLGINHGATEPSALPPTTSAGGSNGRVRRNRRKRRFTNHSTDSTGSSSESAVQKAIEESIMCAPKTASQSDDDQILAQILEESKKDAPPELIEEPITGSVSKPTSTVEDEVMAKVLEESMVHAPESKDTASVDDQIMAQILAESRKQATQNDQFVPFEAGEMDDDDEMDMLLEQAVAESMANKGGSNQDTDVQFDEVVPKEKPSSEDKETFNVCVDLRVYGPNPYQPIYVGETAYYLNPDQIDRVRHLWNKVNPDTEAGIQYHQKLEYIANMAKDMEVMEAMKEEGSKPMDTDD